VGAVATGFMCRIVRHVMPVVTVWAAQNVGR
jgi:hypothetical protein